MSANSLSRAKRANKANPREDRNRPYHPTNNPHGQREDEFFSLKPKKKVELLPRNLAQEDYIEALLDDNVHVVFAVGSAGTGKTMLATQYAMQGLIQEKYEKIVITRPAVGADGEKHGFLPGTILDKMQPWVLPILDFVKEVYSPPQVIKMLTNEVIEVAPLAFMRGRNLKNAIIIADEMQNATPSQVKMLLTRIGEGSKMIVTGDLNQHDRGYETNGLKDFLERISRYGSRKFAVIEFGREHVERHPVIDEVLRLYGED